MFVWRATLDNRYECVVERKDIGVGTLTVKDGDTVLLEQEVFIAYDALYGPDVDDLEFWKSECIRVIDK